MNTTHEGARALWIGTYRADDPAEHAAPEPPREGVWRVDLLDDGTLVDRGRAAAATQPSFVAVHPSGAALYATDESADGAVTVFRVVPVAGGQAELHEVTTLPVAGDDPCHLEIRTSGGEGELLVSCYSSGTLAAVPLDAAGMPTGGPRVTRSSGSGPVLDRQEGPHVHSATLLPGDDVAWVVDLGSDRVLRYRVGADGALAPDGVAVTFPAGAGPRHVALHPSGAAFVACELDSTVAVVDVHPDGTGVVRQVLPACATPADGPSQPAHLALGAGGTRLYVGVRGQDVLSTFAVEPRDGAVVLEHLADTPTGGAWPRHHAVVPARARQGGVDVRDESPGSGPGGTRSGDDVVVVANQGSGNLVALAFGPDGRGRVLSALDLLGAGARPACVVPV